jgi:sulfite reductase (NADPH) flavoprotein alpha-component
VAIPDDAPFTPEQRQWLSGYLAAVGGSGGTGVVVSATTAHTAEASVVEATPLTEAAPVTDSPPGNWPWHDPGLGMQQRLDLAKDTPVADKLMAAMAQTDCHACGYDCRGYADAIATGAETDLSLCLPGEAETANMLKKLMQEAGKL